MNRPVKKEPCAQSAKTGICSSAFQNERVQTLIRVELNAAFTYQLAPALRTFLKSKSIELHRPVIEFQELMKILNKNYKKQPVGYFVNSHPGPADEMVLKTATEACTAFDESKYPVLLTGRRAMALSWVQLLELINADQETIESVEAILKKIKDKLKKCVCA